MTQAKPFSDPAPVRLPLLDGMRGVAALCVLAYHEGSLHGTPGLMGNSYLAVDFFFLLSAFVLTRAFERRFAGGMGTRAFMVLRVARLWPLMAVAALLGALEATLRGNTMGLGAALIRHLLFVPRLEQGAQLFELNGAQWSLLFELLANLAHVAILWRLRTALVGAIAGLSALALLWSGFHYGALNLGWTGTGAWVGLVRVGCFYGLGIVMARLLPRNVPERWTSWRVPLLGLPAIIMAVGLVPGENTSIVFAWAAILLGFPALILTGLLCALPPRVVPLLDWLGRLSFPLYAIHLPLLMLVQRGVPLPDSTGLRPLSVAVVLAAAALMAKTSLGGRRRKRARSPVEAQAVAA